MSKNKKVKLTKYPVFEGAILLKEWTQCADGNQYLVLVGKVKVAPNVDLGGFDASTREANWSAVVEGKKTSVAIFGCQIRGIHRGPWEAPNCYRVK